MTSEASKPRAILVVDDNRDATFLLSRLLRRWGHEVHSAHWGEQALEMASRVRPEVVLLDIGLPDMDGYEVAARLRAMEPSFEGVLVALTGYGSAEDRARMHEAGFAHHLLKPVDSEDLNRLLRELG